MKLLIVLSLVLVYQVAFAKGAPITRQAKIRAILGQEYLLTNATRQLILKGDLLPAIIKNGALAGVVDSWPQLLKNQTRVDALTEISQSTKHLEEAKELLAERYGEEYGEYEYEKLLDLLLIKSGVQEATKEYLNFSKKSAME